MNSRVGGGGFDNGEEVGVIELLQLQEGLHAGGFVSGAEVGVFQQFGISGIVHFTLEVDECQRLHVCVRSLEDRFPVSGVIVAGNGVVQVFLDVEAKAKVGSPRMWVSR